MPKSGIKGKRVVVVFASILLVSFVLMTINIRKGKDGFSPEAIAVLILSPIQSLFTSSAESVSSLFDHYFFLVGVARENESLLREIDYLVKEKNDLQEKILRLDRIGKLLEYEEETERKAVVATVIARDATQWSKMIFINRGTQDGIHENLAVVTDAGVIGHVIHSTVNSSKVLLVTDSRSAVDSLFQDSRIPGVVVGKGEEECDMEFVPITADVKAGDKVISSGLGGVFPKGLVVGKVVKVTKKKQRLFQDITIKPRANLSRLEEVLVLLPD